MFKTKSKQHSHGFTLIEMIVSLGVFSIIVTIAVGALLALISGNQKLQGEQSIMTNISFALDSMTREIRTGYFYVCADANSENQPVHDLNPPVSPPPKIFKVSDSDHDRLGESTKDCPTGPPDNYKFQGVSFWEGGNSITGGELVPRIMYYYDVDAKTIMRRVVNNPPQPVISSGLAIVDADFIVTGSDREASGNTVQPTVTIYIKAVAKEDEDAYSTDPDSVKTYQLETTVTQRILDL